MAATPPHQITTTPQTPPTPLHGAAYDRPTRQSARIRQRELLQDSQSTPEPVPRSRRSIASPASSNHLSLPVQSPQATPRKSSRRVQVISPSSPDTDLSPPKPTKQSNSHLQPFNSTTTTMIHGIPTPVKTPKKKNVPNIHATARALFQDANGDSELIAPSPRKGRKNKRYNGFTLESFKAEADVGSRVQIFMDNRDKVPEVDTTESNPFLEPPAHAGSSRPKQVAGSSKRRKVSREKPVDPQVEEAIKNGDGMVYVFRGKKVYRRFDDTGEEEEEEIDAEDLGLLEHVQDGEARVKPLKTLTRKSIRPTRLFQSETQKRDREREKEEEALTDVEDQSTAVAESSEAGARSTRTSANVSSKIDRMDKARKASPFDSWPRVKGSSRHSSASKGQKRTASEALDDTSPTGTVETSKVRKTRA